MMFLLRLCILFATVLAMAPGAFAAEGDAPSEFRVGFGKRDITPPTGIPMWGYGARRDMKADGVLDPLYAKVVVIHAGGQKLAIMGLDIGRGPTAPMMKQIREEIAKAGIEHVMISGSHTHHGPVIELTDQPGYGKGKYQKAVDYSQELPKKLIEAILEADAAAKPARIGVATKDVQMNRNRQTKREPKAVEPMLATIRFDDADGKPIAILVNFAAHPVMTDGKVLKFSADYPGFLQAKVESELKTNCFFMQGACGDLSPSPPQGISGPEQFGKALADEVIALARDVKTAAPAKPSIQGKTDEFAFRSRVDFRNPGLQLAFSVAFFPELVMNFIQEFGDGIPAELNTVLLNNEIALVGGSGEFFCNHSVRLKERAYFPHTLFFGYCNGHSMYFPTIEAASEGGYGADATVSPPEVGAGEQMMNRALINLYTFQDKLKDLQIAISSEE